MIKANWKLLWIFSALSIAVGISLADEVGPAGADYKAQFLRNFQKKSELSRPAAVPAPVTVLPAKPAAKSKKAGESQWKDGLKTRGADTGPADQPPGKGGGGIQLNITPNHK